MRGYYLPLIAGVALVASTFLPWVIIGDTVLRGMPNVPALWVAGIGVIAVVLAALSIITRKNSAPKKDWLGIVKTAGARSHIRKYLREHGQAED